MMAMTIKVRKFSKKNEDISDLYTIHCFTFIINIFLRNQICFHL